MKILLLFLISTAAFSSVMSLTDYQVFYQKLEETCTGSKFTDCEKLSRQNLEITLTKTSLDAVESDCKKSKKYCNYAAWFNRVNKNHTKAMEYAQIGCNANDRYACMTLAYEFNNLKKTSDAVKFSKKSCGLKNVKGCNYLADLYLHELKDKKNAQKYYYVSCASNDALACYNSACIHSLNMELNEALAQLAKSFNLGMDKWEEIDKDTDLINLKKDPRYNQLIKKFKLQ
jgi:hypothetical protein